MVHRATPLPFEAIPVIVGTEINGRACHRRKERNDLAEAELHLFHELRCSCLSGCICGTRLIVFFQEAG